MEVDGVDLEIEAWAIDDESADAVRLSPLAAQFGHEMLNRAILKSVSRYHTEGHLHLNS